MENRKIFNILIIDHPQKASILSEFFKNKGFHTSICFNAIQGFHYLKTTKIDLLLLNLVLTGNISGYEMCQQVKQDPETCQIPVILLADRKLPKEIEQAHHLELGTNALFSRPFQPEDLYQTVKNLITFLY